MYRSSVNEAACFNCTSPTRYFVQDPYHCGRDPIYICTSCMTSSICKQCNLSAKDLRANQAALQPLLNACKFKNHRHTSGSSLEPIIDMVSPTHLDVYDTGAAFASFMHVSDAASGEVLCSSKLQL